MLIIYKYDFLLQSKTALNTNFTLQFSLMKGCNNYSLVLIVGLIPVLIAKTTSAALEFTLSFSNRLSLYVSTVRGLTFIITAICL